MYIWIISRGVPSKSSPLNGIFEFDQAKALCHAGHKVLFIALDFRSIWRMRKFGFFYTQIEGLDVFKISLPLGNVELPVFNVIARLFLWLSRGHLQRTFGKPDLLHAHFYSIGSIGIGLKDYFQVPFILTEHSSIINADYIAPHIYKLAKRCYSSSDALICVSGSLAERVLKRFGKDAHIVNNLVDTTSFFVGRGINTTSEFRFISVGNLTHNKGFDILLEAFSKADFGLRTYLDIYGGGSCHSVIEHKIKSLGLTENVFLNGEINREEIADAMRNSDVFVLASRSETFGVVFIEAMSTGLPVVATCCGGPEDFVNDENGILVPVDDVEALSQALVYMRRNHINFDRCVIAERTREKFSPSTIVGHLEIIYEELLSRHL